jgi:hypothetical protein
MHATARFVLGTANSGKREVYKDQRSEYQQQSSGTRQEKAQVDVTPAR